MALSSLKTLLKYHLSESEIDEIFELLFIDPALVVNDSKVSQNVIAQAMNMILFNRLIKRVPPSRDYCVEQRVKDRKIVFDHGALRTVAIDMANLPKGHLAFKRILEPLGYEQTGVYPLEKLNMCGFVYTHSRFPETIPQYFVSELYPERFSSMFQATVSDLVYYSQDPISPQGETLLKELDEHLHIEMSDAIQLLPDLIRAFDRQHSPPTPEQYQILSLESKEMAWISTEGNAFNHATDRVDDLDFLERSEKEKGRPMKPSIEEGKTANIRQTAYRASTIERPFKSEEGLIFKPVPGSFFEFIERGKIVDPTTGEEKMDLRFDSMNAQGIFSMTRSENRA